MLYIRINVDLGRHVPTAPVTKSKPWGIGTDKLHVNEHMNMTRRSEIHKTGPTDGPPSLPSYPSES